MRKNLLTQILLSFLALALLASASPAQSTESTKGTQPAATPKTTKTKISAKKAALVDINSASKEELDALPGIGDTLARSEEHTSELQSRFDLVCRLLLE